MTIQNVQAVIFDMDGTLVDSELITEQAVKRILRESEVTPENLDYTQFYGITWLNIESILQDIFPILGTTPLAGRLQHYFHTMGIEDPPAAIEGAQCAVQEASAHLKTAIGTSSNRESLDEVTDRLQLREVLSFAASAEDYERSKPAPDCYLLVAKNLGVAPEACLVFEDSIPGIRAAQAAQMQVVAVTHRSPNEVLARELADLAISNYTELPKDFWQSIAMNS